ncbi:hypothetical protein H5410_038582 [Solanum commersonii]|uniref:Uncharacterized protein n=1 Tax=Solanum commersonii TaxID=4109 RepID=A0A9J5YEC2_SOLCO|nr:hypothetical protein H5410_038582 [Solanum commersonii]
MDKKVVWDPMGNTKYCERVDVQLEEREEKKTKGLNMCYIKESSDGKKLPDHNRFKLNTDGCWKGNPGKLAARGSLANIGETGNPLYFVHCGRLFAMTSS